MVTLEPLVINAEDFDLAPGLENLRKLADLSAISLSVPVGAVLISRRADMRGAVFLRRDGNDSNC